MADRYMRKALAGIICCPAVANLGGPTTAELAAGTPLHVQLSDVNGFQFTNQPINTPDFDSTFTSQIEGEDTADASSFGFYELDDFAANTIYAALPKGTSAVLVFSPYSKVPVTGDNVECWPMKITGRNRAWTAANEASKYVTTAAVTARPNQDAVVAA